MNAIKVAVLMKRISFKIFFSTTSVASLTDWLYIYVYFTCFLDFKLNGQHFW